MEHFGTVGCHWVCGLHRVIVFCFVMIIKINGISVGFNENFLMVFHSDKGDKGLF